MEIPAAAPSTAAASRAWQKIVARYAQPNLRRSLWGIITSFGPYLLLWALMYFSLRIHYALTLLLAFVTAGFMVRIFIILHDCGHGSYFKSSRANDWVGLFSGVFAFTPFFSWRHNHAKHHATPFRRAACWCARGRWNCSKRLSNSAQSASAASTLPPWIVTRCAIWTPFLPSPTGTAWKLIFICMSRGRLVRLP